MCRVFLARLFLVVLLGTTLVTAPVAAEPSKAEEPTETNAVSNESDEARKPKSEFRQEIVVTATIPELPTFTTISGRELTDQPSQDVVQSIRLEPGLSAFRRGPINLDPQIRGLQETEVAVLVDGTRTFAAGPARMDSGLSHVSPHAVQKLEVIKGPYALTWGAGALGAIQLQTIRPDFHSGQLRWDGQAGLRYSDNGSATDAYAGTWGSNDRWRFQALVNGRGGDDYEAGDGAEVPGGYTSFEGNLVLGLRPSERTIVEFSGGYQEQKDIDYAGRILDATYFYTRSYVLDVSWIPESNSSRLSELFGQLYDNRKDHRMNNDNKPTAQPNPDRVPPFPIEVDLPTESNTFGGRLYLAGGSESLQWKAGTDLYALEQTATRTISRRDTGMVVFEDIVWPDAEIDDLGIYGHLRLRRSRTELGGTLRIDFVDASAGMVSEFFQSNIEGPLDESETNVSAAFSLSSRVSDAWIVTAGLGRAMRTASVLERYSDRFPATKFQVPAEFLGNPRLEPETSLQLDLGAEYGHGRILLGASAFYRVIDEYITVLPDPAVPPRLPLSPPIVFRYINGDDATFWGGELYMHQRFGKRFQIRGNLSTVRGEDEIFNEPVFGLPPMTAQLGVRWEQSSGRIWVDVQATIMDEQDRVASQRFEQPTPGATTYNIAGGLRIGEDLELRLGIENLTDKLYSHHLNTFNPFTGERVPEIGRNVFAAVEYRF